MTLGSVDDTKQALFNVPVPGKPKYAPAYQEYYTPVVKTLLTASTIYRRGIRKSTDVCQKYVQAHLNTVLGQV